MTNQLFATYSQGENRVTASILAVFERVSFALLERILQSLCQETETALVTFTNQTVLHSAQDGHKSVPDARIRGSFGYWIETKIKPNSIDPKQIRDHLQGIEADSSVQHKRLIVLTPDGWKPRVGDELNDARVAWNSFGDLVDAIGDAVETPLDWLTVDQPLCD